MTPCMSVAGGCPARGPVRYWYGLPPWPAALWAWRRQFDVSAVDPICTGRSRLWHAPAYLVSIAECGRSEPDPRVIPVVITVREARDDRSRLWPFRWAIEAGPLEPPASSPSALDSQGDQSLSIII